MDFEQSTRPTIPADEVMMYQDKRPVRLTWAAILSAFSLFNGTGALNLGKPRRVTGTGNTSFANEPTLVISADAAATSLTMPTTGMADGDSRVYFNNNTAGAFTINGPFMGGLGASIPVARGNVLWVFWSATDNAYGVL